MNTFFVALTVLLLLLCVILVFSGMLHLLIKSFAKEHNITYDQALEFLRGKGDKHE